MKKFTSLLMALVMMFALSATAFAVEDETTEDPTLIIAQNPVGDNTTPRTYNAYKLFDLETSHKEEDHHTCPKANGSSAEHEDACYNYAYTLNETYKTVLQNEVFANASENFWTQLDVTKPLASSGVQPNHILDYLASLTSDGGTHYGTLRAAADRIYRAIKTASMEADTTLVTGENENFEQGYWLIADTTSITDDAYDSNSLVMLDTKASAKITLTPKVALPVVEKKVKDIDDSEQTDSLTNDWVDSADHDIDSNTFAFKLTGTLPTNLDGYETYKMVFHDTMSEGLTLDPDSFEIFLYANKNAADGDNNMDNGTKIYPIEGSDTNNNYDVKLTPDDGDSFDVTITNAKAVLDNKGTKAHGGNAIVIVYKATLNGNAKLGEEGNPNEVYLEFSNDPYSDGTGQTKEDKVIVFTYGLTINKIDSHGHKLKGAEFTLYKKSAKDDHAYIQVSGPVMGEDLTTFEWKGLDDGDYKLVETEVPDGYNKMEDIFFTITASHTNGDTPELREVKSEVMGIGDLDSGIITKDIINNTGTVLPETGGTGTVMLISASSLFVVLAAVFMITRKKMSIYAD